MSGKSMAEREVLLDAVFVRGVDDRRAAQRAPALRPFGLAQVTTAGLLAQHFAARRDFEPLRHGLFGFDAFGTSHKNQSTFFQKERAL